MTIDYISKEIQEINSENIKAKVISYEITEQDMYLIANMQNEEYELKRIFLRKDNIIDMVVDNIDAGFVVQGGKIEDKFILKSFIVKEGLQQLLTLLSLQ